MHETAAAALEGAEEEREISNSPAMPRCLSSHASSFVHWSLTGVLQTDAASIVAFSSRAQGQAFEVCAWGISQVKRFARDLKAKDERRRSAHSFHTLRPSLCADFSA